jgi:hypothetical protein
MQRGWVIHSRFVSYYKADLDLDQVLFNVSNIIYLKINQAMIIVILLKSLFMSYIMSKS